MSFIDLLLKILRVQLDRLVILIQKIIKLVQHAENLAALVAHNSVRLLVKQHRHSVSAIIVLLTLEVDILQVCEALVALDGVRHDILARNIFVLGHESPAALAKMPMDNRERDEVLKALKLTGDEGATCPWACVAYVEVVAALLGRILGVGIARDGVSE
ncbi:hypothetical protein HG530_010076 [Fusarium avenaceum]|nr:hypothetical protein HG530_010076 [Fusarium avenaceum]